MVVAVHEAGFPLPLSVSGFDLRRIKKEKKEIVRERAVSNQGSNVRIDDDGNWTDFFLLFLTELGDRFGVKDPPWERCGNLKVIFVMYV